MRRSELQQKADGEEIVKCGCGLPMRRKNWMDHWWGCRVGSSVPVTEQDRKDLLAYEERRKKDDEAHQKWLKDRQAQVDAARSDGRVSI